MPIGGTPALTAPVRTGRPTLPPPPTDRVRGWVVTLTLTLVAAVVRLWDIGLRTDGGTPLFDEKYYALQAAEVIRNGGVEDNQAFGVVVHPPLGKQIIALGELVAGYTPTGWRLAPAVAGIICVLVMVRVVRRMTRSTLLGGIAGVLIICDGVSHVQSRSALLDILQTVFVLAAFSCVIADRDQVRARLAASVRDDGEPGRFGVVLGARWWRFAAGVLLGLAIAIKWSGVYWVAAFGVMVVVWDITARRDSGVTRPVQAVVRRDLVPSLWSLAVIPVATYVATWWAWFASANAWPRSTLVATPEFRSDWKSGLLYQLGSFWDNALWQWTWKMLDFHSHLLTPTDPAKRHPWESKPWTWPLGTRPVNYYSPGAGTGCGDGRTDCVQRILLIGTPALWWISLFVAGWALWKAIGRLDWRYAAVLVGYGAGYLPWFTNLDRQMYFFYATPLAPFLIIGITLVLGDILGRSRVGVERRYLAVTIVAIYVGLVVANFAYLWPILNGVPITPDGLQMRTWLPSWG
ncbi:phospholipid carrier-dependent glycosyltransferase [Nakamurella flavida]|uniref:Polyprenol-phosphate-mannose--protein mannosyltransferase n=2 Tax=Nakamurella flavida TaxID=363630 RepID=A0A939C351_9ACTN|nr:phospholipid carrier-dependent glycosyltransferase [Nakamurella flavida]